MRLLSVIAEMHLMGGQSNGAPIRLLLRFDQRKPLQLRVAGDGQRMILVHEDLEMPVDMGDCGRTEIVDFTQSISSKLVALDVTEISGLDWMEYRIGICLTLGGQEPLYFWVDSDELHWGDGEKLNSHPWLDGVMPIVSEALVLPHE